jgi:hypothetical protein
MSAFRRTQMMKSNAFRRTHETTKLNRPLWRGERVVGENPITGGPILGGPPAPGKWPADESTRGSKS